MVVLIIFVYTKVMCDDIIYILRKALYYSFNQHTSWQTNHVTITETRQGNEQSNNDLLCYYVSFLLSNIIIWSNNIK